MKNWKMDAMNVKSVGKKRNTVYSTKDIGNKAVCNCPTAPVWWEQALHVRTFRPDQTVELFLYNLAMIVF